MNLCSILCSDQLKSKTFILRLFQFLPPSTSPCVRESGPDLVQAKKEVGERSQDAGDVYGTKEKGGVSLCNNFALKPSHLGGQDHCQD